MRDPGDHTAQQSTETLQIGASRPPLFQNLPTQWRQRAVALLAFVLGVASGVGAVLGWQGSPRPAQSPFHVDEHAVELMLFEVEPPRVRPSGWASGHSPLQVDGAVFLSGAVAATVLWVDSLDPSLEVRAPALPVAVSPATRLKSVNIEIAVQDCKGASRWTPVDRPFTITWRDERGKRHLDRAGDFDRSMARSLIAYVDAACPTHARAE